MVSDVFTKPLQLLCARLDLYMPLRRCYSLEERVIIANTFLLPTLGYTQRLFVMPEHLIDLVMKRLSPWLAPASRFAPGLLCSPARWRDRHLPHTLPGTPCALCGRHPETSSHLFLECRVSAAAIHCILNQSVNRAQVEVLTVATLDDF